MKHADNRPKMLLNGPQFATKETIDILEITRKHATVLQKTVTLCQNRKLKMVPES